MDCLDMSRSIHALIAVTLILAGCKLMMTVGRVSRGFGAYCLAFGYFILALAASDQSLGFNIDVRSRRYIIAIASVIAIIAGSFMMYYHVQDRIKRAFQSKMTGFKQDVIKSIPIIDHILIYGGFLGLLLSISMNDDNSINMVRAGLALVAFVVIGFTKYKLMETLIDGKEPRKYQIANILSYGLLVLAIGYNC